jgi:hypothetical protein
MVTECERVSPPAGVYKIELYFDSKEQAEQWGKEAAKIKECKPSKVNVPGKYAFNLPGCRLE